MKRTLLWLILMGAGGGLVGFGLLSGGDEQAANLAYVETAPCPGCPVNLQSAEVQDRQGSMLFVFRGTWPATTAQIPGDVRLTANDLDLVLHPVDEGLEITEGGLGPLDVAAGIQDGALLINVSDDVLSAPVEFSLYLVAPETPRIPRAGMLLWSGSGAPRLAREAPETGPKPETPEEFAQNLTAAFRDGDDDFLLQTLHPAVIDVYGRRQCARFTAGLKPDPTREVTVLETSGLEPYDYAPDGLSITIPDTYTLTVDSTVRGESGTSELHLAPVDGNLGWFTDCGDPL